MQYTSNYNLRKPDPTDNYNVANDNSNMDVIDTQLKANAQAAAAAVAPNAATDTVIGSRTADPTQVPTGLVGTLTQWLSWLTNRIKAITGTPNWNDAPPTTLTAANAHMNNMNNPHGVTTSQIGAETPTGAQAKVDAHANNTNNPHNVTAAQVGAIPTTAKGANSGVCDLDAGGQVPASRLGNVPPVNASTTTTLGTVQVASAPNSGNPVAASRSASVSDVQITTTNATTVATHTPTSQKNYMVLVSLRVVTAATNVTLTITWTDASGAQVDTRINNQSLSVGTHDVPVKFINAVSGQPIAVNVTAGTANQIYASAAIVGV